MLHPGRNPRVVGILLQQSKKKSFDFSIFHIPPPRLHTLSCIWNFNNIPGADLPERDPPFPGEENPDLNGVFSRVTDDLANSPPTNSGAILYGGPIAPAVGCVMKRRRYSYFGSL